MKPYMSSTLVVLGLSFLGTGAAIAAPATVAADINLRRGPGVKFGVVTVIPAGENVNRGRCARNNWCRVSWNGASGYLNASYLVAARSGRVVRSRRVYEEPETIYVRPRVQTYRYDYGYDYGASDPYYGGTRNFGGTRYYDDTRYYGGTGFGRNNRQFYGNRNDGNRFFGNRNYGNAPAPVVRQQNNSGGGAVLGQPSRPEAGQGLTYSPGGQVSGTGSGAPGVEPNFTAGAR